jgi:hypothetical protein
VDGTLSRLSLKPLESFLEHLRSPDQRQQRRLSIRSLFLQRERGFEHGVKKFVLKLSFCECGVHERDLLSEERTTRPEIESLSRMAQGIVEFKAVEAAEETPMTEADIELRHLYFGPGKGGLWQAVHVPTGKYVQIRSRTERAVQEAYLELADLVPPKNIRLDPAWLTSTVKQLAQSIYDEKAFERLPILADALEDAGCTSEDILNHCRQPGEHVRGCWVVDLVLGKE